jgi:glycosyltransferase involved in cell wall biosynthesis
MPSAPAVSVVMIAYNVAPFVEQAIDSVLGQTYRQIELVLVDDESTDDTWARITAVAGRDPRLRPLRIAHSGHPAHARNAGLKICTGEFITFLDGDDFFQPDRVERVMALFAAVPALDLVFHDTARVDVEGRPTGDTYLSESHFAERAAAYLTPHGDTGFLAGDRFDAFSAAIFCPVHTSTVTVRRAWFERQPSAFDGGLLAGGEDLDLWYRLLHGARVGFVDAALASYRSRPGSVTSDRRRFILGTLQADARNLERYRADLTAAEATYLRKRIARRYRHLAVQHEQFGSLAAARENYAISLRWERRPTTALLWLKSFVPKAVRDRARGPVVPILIALILIALILPRALPASYDPGRAGAVPRSNTMIRSCVNASP